MSQHLSAHLNLLVHLLHFLKFGQRKTIAYLFHGVLLFGFLCQEVGDHLGSEDWLLGCGHLLLFRLLLALFGDLYLALGRLQVFEEVFAHVYLNLFGLHFYITT